MKFEDMTREQLIKTCEILSNKVYNLTAGIKDVAALIDNRSGVVGLHLNGDVATWESLREGGRFEEWLKAFDAALEAL